MRSFFFVLALSSAAAFAQDAGSSTCPSSLKEGAVCSEPYLACSTGDAGSCECRPRQCVSAAGPIPNCKRTAQWVCRHDGCPSQPYGTCAVKGKRCGYDDGLCATTMTCTDAGWALAKRNCRPSARPR